MTTSIDSVLLAVRTDAGHPLYAPLSAAQSESLQGFYARLGDKGKHGQGSSFGMDEFTDLIKQGLGSDMLYIACHGTPDMPQGFPKLARRILKEDINANPSLLGADGNSAFTHVESNKNYAFFDEQVDMLMRGRIAAARPPKLIDPNTCVISAAQEPAPATPVAPLASASPRGLSIVEQARAGMHKARAEAATTPLRPLSAEAQQIHDAMFAKNKAR